MEYLSRELARKIEVEVHCWGQQHSDQGKLHVRGQEPWSEITQGTEEKFKGALEALSLNLTQIKALAGIDVVHTHTWYVSMAGYLAREATVPDAITQAKVFVAGALAGGASWQLGAGHGPLDHFGWSEGP